MFNLFLRLSTSKVFHFHKISVGIMLQLRLSFVLEDLLLISFWLSANIQELHLSSNAFGMIS